MRRSELILLVIAGLMSVAGIVWAASSPATSDTVSQRLDVIRAMTPEQRSKLLANQQRFNRLPEDEQQRLRDLQQEIADETETNELRGVLDRYDQWLSELPYAESSRVRSLDPDQRLKKITVARKKESQAQIVTREQEKHLTDKDWRTIRRWWSVGPVGVTSNAPGHWPAGT